MHLLEGQGWGNVTAGDSPSCGGGDGAALGLLLSPFPPVPAAHCGSHDGRAVGLADWRDMAPMKDFGRRCLKARGPRAASASVVSVGSANMLAGISARCSSPTSSSYKLQSFNPTALPNHTQIICRAPVTIMKQDLSQFKIHCNNQKAFQRQL